MVFAPSKFRLLSRQLFVYMPGLVILVFSMLALHSSLVIVRMQEQMIAAFEEEAVSLSDLEQKYLRFETALLFYLENPEIGDSTDVKGVFTEFAAHYSDKINGPNARNPRFSKTYHGHLEEIDGYLTPVSLELKDLEFPGLTAPQKFLALLEPMREKIQNLSRHLVNEYGQNGYRQDLLQREDMLYWSVIAVGFAGFILVLLNANKLHQLRLADEEREAATRLLQLRLEALESSFDGIGIIDQSGRLTYMNAALRDLHGISEEESKNYLGQDWGTLYTLKGQDYIKTSVMPVLRKNGKWRGESPILRNDGQIVFADLHLTKLPDDRGYIGMARNITERKKADKAREELQNQLHQAQKMEAIGRLAGGFAHDFNNILASMIGYAEFLLDDLDQRTPQYNFAKNIFTAGQQARGLVDQILAFSRRQKNVSEMTNISLGLCLEESLAIIAASMPKIIELQTDIKSKVIISGNSSQISQLIINLCVNALDAMENQHGKLKISLQEVSMADYEFARFLLDDDAHPDHTSVPRIQELRPGHTRLFLNAPARSGRYAILSVKDTGTGMSREVLEHVFEPFFTTKAVDKGTGLGLSMAHATLANHNAALMIDSVVGEGTLFQIFFPLSSATIDSRIDSDGQPHLMLAGQKILFVDDQDDVRDMMVSMLERIGAEAYGCASAEDAIEVIRENENVFDIVITDQSMPKMTGLELVNEISKDYPNLPFVLLSGYSEEKLQTLMREHPGIKTVLKKPISKATLLEELGRIFDIKPERQKRQNRA